AMDDGARREGSQFGFVAVNGVRWERVGNGFRVTLPGGNEMVRIHRMIQARLPHGKHLLVHDTNPEQPLAVALRPSDHLGLGVDGAVLVIDVPADGSILDLFANPAPGPMIWNLS